MLYKVAFLSLSLIFVSETVENNKNKKPANFVQMLNIISWFYSGFVVTTHHHTHHSILFNLIIGLDILFEDSISIK